nr:hypothetical protein P9270_023160 [Mesorhizobium sp. WSM4875]
MVLVPNALQFLHVAGNVEIFMRHATVAGAGIAPDDAGVPIGEVGTGSLEQPIAGTVELRSEARVLDDQLHVGVVEKQIIIDERRSICMIERGVAGLLEIFEGELMQLPGQVAIGEESPDVILGPVGRPGVADDPAVDVVDNRPQTALQVRHLVLDDHVQAKSLARGHP